MDKDEFHGYEDLNTEDEEKELEMLTNKKNIKRGEMLREKKQKSKFFLIGILMFLLAFSGLYFAKDKIKATIIKVSTKINATKQGENTVSEETNKSENKNKINIESGSRATFVGYGKNYMYCNKDGVKFFDNNQNQLWNYTYTMTSPSVVNDGSCTAIVETQGRMAKVYNESKEMYAIQTDGSILQAAINKSGVLAVVLKDSTGYKIQVYSETGRLLMERIDQDEGVYPLALDISEDKKVLIVSYLDTNEVELTGKVLFFHINRDDAKNADSGDFFASISRNGTIMTAVKYLDNGNCIAIGDNMILCFDSEGKELWNMDITNKIDKVAFGDGKHTIVAFGEIFSGMDGKENGTVAIFDENGKVKSEVPIGRPVTYLSAYKEGVIVGAGRDFVCMDYSGKILWSHTATQDVKDIILLSSSSKALYVTNNSAEIVDMKNK